MRGAETWYWVTAARFLIGAALALNLIDSPTGRALRAIHDSEIAARVLGVDVAKQQARVFVVSAVYASVAGSCLALLNGLITPDASGFLRSIELVTMVVLGGMARSLGSLVGAALLVVLPQMLTVFHDYEHMVLALIMMLFMIFLRAGIVPSSRTLLRRGGRMSVLAAERPRDRLRRRARGRRCEPRRSRRARSSPSSDRTAPARPRCSISSPGIYVPERGRVRLDGEDVTGARAGQRWRGADFRAPSRTCRSSSA